MATPFLLAERVTRDGRRLGVKAFTADIVKEMADSGQGLIVGNCSADGLQRHIPHVCRNALPSRTLVACHSYEFASNLFERPSWNGAQRSALLRENRAASGVSGTPILVTVIEKLYSLRKLARDRQYLPSLLHLVDPHGISIRTADIGTFCGARAQAISKFRAACLAAGHQVAPMLWTLAPCGAFVHDKLCELMGVEAFVYLDGSTVRSASLSEDGPQVESITRREHPLDNMITAALTGGRRLLVVTGRSAKQNDGAVRQLAGDRKYTVLDLSDIVRLETSAANFWTAGIDVVRAMRLALATELRRVNKRVVVVVGADDIARKFGVHTAIRTVLDNALGCLIVTPAPLGVGAIELSWVFRDIATLDPVAPVPECVDLAP